MPKGIYKKTEKHKANWFPKGHKVNLGKKQNWKHNWMKGKHHTEEAKKKISLTNTGRKLTEETKKKLSEAHKGKLFSEEHKQNIGLSRKGIKFSSEHIESLRKSHKGQNIAEKNPNWKGGISFEPYSVDWTETLKRSIKERDKYTCQICKSQPEILYIHHIDYNKQNSNPDNLITLCNSCHSKTNFNRSSWINYFKNYGNE